MDQMIDISGFTLCCALVLGAVICFVLLQQMLTDPERSQINKKWFEQFEAQLRKRYADNDLKWRVNALSDLFRRA